jgi:hypothetical protein
MLMRRTANLTRFGCLAALISCAASACGGQAASDPPNTVAGASGASTTDTTSGGKPANQGGNGGNAGATQPAAGSGSGGLAGSAGAGGATVTLPARSSVSLEGNPFYTRAQRLTNSQWQRAVVDVLRLANAPNLAADFETPVAIKDFTNNEQVLSVTSRLAQSYETAAEAAAALATGSDAALAALYGGADAEGFVREFGRRAFRRPLTTEEEQKYLALFAQGETLYGAGFANGSALVIRAMLQAPAFLYRTELGAAGDPLDGYELASKLSFWLLGTTPSDALLDSAAAGELDSTERLEATARQMLDQAAAVEVMRDFHGQLLHFGRYATIDKVGVAEYTQALNAELEEASYLFFDRMVEENLGLREVFSSSTGYVGPAMAAIYGVPAPASGFEARDLGSSRAGFFTQLPFLILHSHNDTPDPIRRGLTLHTDMLCAELGAPIADIPTIPPLEPGQTNRERITALIGSCGGACHGVFMDPLGFAFENFDGMGRERTTDNGKPVDTASSYPFAEGTESFEGAAELMEIMAQSPQAHTCYSKKLASYALQRDIVEPDRPLLEDMAAVSRDQSLKELVISLVRDPAFRLRQENLP